MSKEKWNDIQKILRDDRLEFDVKCNSNMFCVICEKVLVNAHSAPCGCRYCLDCITNYLNGEDKFCPGNTDECKDELLNIKHNIHIDQPINREILKIFVKCPEKNCEFKCELRKLEDHMRICDYRSIDCPYLNIGCKDSKIVINDMKNHLSTEIYSHTKLLFQLIENLRNEIQILKDDNVELKKDRDYLKKFINDSEIKNENERREMKEKIKEIEIRLVEENKKNVNELKKEIKLVKNETESIKRDASQNKRENESKIDEINKTMSDLKSISNESDKSISNLENEVRVLEKKQEQQIGGEFVWRIDKWKVKLEQARAGINTNIFSDAFYSHRNGYKMCLRVDPNGVNDGKGTHLGVLFCLMRGEFDDILPWPFKHDVTFELIDQHTTQIHTSETMEYGSDPNISDIYRKPISDRNTAYGDSTFISLGELSNNLSLTDNDQIFIRCRVKID